MSKGIRVSVEKECKIIRELVKREKSAVKIGAEYGVGTETVKHIYKFNEETIRVLRDKLANENIDMIGRIEGFITDEKLKKSTAIQLETMRAIRIDKYLLLLGQSTSNVNLNFEKLLEMRNGVNKDLKNPDEKNKKEIIEVDDKGIIDG